MKAYLPIFFLALMGNVLATERPMVFFDLDGKFSEGRNSERSMPSNSRNLERRKSNSERSRSNERANLLASARSDRSSEGPVKFGLDVGDQDVSSVQFLISSGRRIVDSVDISRCAAYLPDTHVGGCKIKGEKILFYAFSPVNAKLETGFLGELDFSRPVNAASLQITEEIMGDTQGAEIKN